MDNTKDIITIYDDNNEFHEMEVVLSFHDEIKDVEYIIYKKPESIDECFAAKYVQNGDDLELDTNLTEEELNMLKVVLKQGRDNGNKD